MNSVIKKLAESSEDLKSFALQLKESGVQSVRGAVSNFGIVRSLFAGNSDTERDETHYFLLPDFTGAKAGVVYTTRVLPEGVLSENSLPKARVFHIANGTGTQRLEALLEEETKHSISRTEPSADSDLATALERFAEKIDEESNYLTGGIMLVGGVVTVFNPLVGIGISLAGWAAALGSKASVVGTEYLSTKVRQWTEAKADKQLTKEAGKVISALKPEIYENPVISSLEMMAQGKTGDYDPFLDRENWIDSFTLRQYHSLTMSAVTEVYDSRESLEGLSHLHRSWIKSLGQVE